MYMKLNAKLKIITGDKVNMEKNINYTIVFLFRDINFMVRVTEIIINSLNTERDI